MLKKRAAGIASSARVYFGRADDKCSSSGNVLKSDGRAAQASRVEHLRKFIGDGRKASVVARLYTLNASQASQGTQAER